MLGWELNHISKRGYWRLNTIRDDIDLTSDWYDGTDMKFHGNYVNGRAGTGLINQYIYVNYVYSTADDTERYKTQDTAIRLKIVCL